MLSYKEMGMKEQSGVSYRALWGAAARTGGRALCRSVFLSDDLPALHGRGPQGTIAYLKTFGVYAVFMSFFIDVVINVVGFLPSIFISTANGLIFGLFWGTIIPGWLKRWASSSPST